MSEKMEKESGKIAGKPEVPKGNAMDKGREHVGSTSKDGMKFKIPDHPDLSKKG